jgi:hypothetical protein
MLRYGTQFFLLSPAIPWGLVIGSTFISLILERLLHAQRVELAARE